MKCYHSTTIRNAKCILEGGFRNLGQSDLWPQVWVSDVPLNANDGVDKALIPLEIDLPDGLFEKYEVSNRSHDFREAHMPAKVLNQCGPARLHDEELRPLLQLTDEDLERLHL